MDERLRELRRGILEGRHLRYRQDMTLDIDGECRERNLSWTKSHALLCRRMCEAEMPVIEDGELIVFTRTVKSAAPPSPPPSVLAAVEAGDAFYIDPMINNICADWGMAVSQGLDERRRVAEEAKVRLGTDGAAADFLEAAVETIDAVLSLARRYALEASRRGRDDIFRMLSRVPARPPRDFHEALQSLRFLNAAVWLSGHFHVGLGRFDQYMWPFLQADLAGGVLDLAGAQELVEEFFISLNKDSDLYGGGFQRGDNGQSMMLGGMTPEGRCAVNDLTVIALRAARETAMIDPKINLRISRETDDSLLVLASELTRMGLGFPQYANDDVVIPALAAHGYDMEDARDYTVAACWEFIIPGKGMEVVNIGAVSFPAAVDEAIRAALRSGGEFADVIGYAAANVGKQVEALVDRFRLLVLPPAPFYSVLMDGCLESGCDLSAGMKYNNYGIHGACASSAADALSAVKRYVYEDGSVSPERLLAALEEDFENDEPLRKLLAQSELKVGDDCDYADRFLTLLYEVFADACEAVGDNGRGGKVRPGTGSAMYYLWLARGFEGGRGMRGEPVVGATADGRRCGEPFGSSLSPSLNARVKGPLSVLRSFSKIDYGRVYNGGPVTLELSDAVFRSDEDLEKIAMLVKAFVRLGCQQLQLNTVDIEKLLDAKDHPERHRNLVVRVWGWSGYFCELEEEYQDHIISRQRHVLT